MNRCLFNLTGLLAVLVGSASCAHAATVTLSIVKDPAAVGCTGCTLSGPGTYQLFAQDSLGDNQGIVGYAIPIQGVSSLLHRSPRANVDDGEGNTNPAGFTVLRSANNQTPQGTGYLFGGGQDTITPTPYVINGFGQTAGSFASVLPPTVEIIGAPTQGTWAAKLLLAEGSYQAGKTPSIDLANIDAFVNVRTNQGTVAKAAISLVPFDFAPVIVPQSIELLIPTSPSVSNLQLTATDAETPAGSLLWSNLLHSGASIGVPATLDSAGHFRWNALGSFGGLHQFTATVTDSFGNTRTDVALNVNVKLSPEPGSIVLGGIALVGCIGFAVQRRWRAMARHLLAVAGLLAVFSMTAPGVKAATATLSIVQDPVSVGCTGCTLSGAGTYQLFAEVSHGDNFGISLFSIPVLGVQSILNRAPRTVVDPDNDIAPAGFTVLRSANNQNVIPNGFLIMALQDTVSPTPYLIRGFGQTASSFATDPVTAGQVTGGQTTQPSWAAKLLLAEGTYLPGSTPHIDFSNDDLFVKVFDTASGTSSCVALANVGGGFCSGPSDETPPTIVPQSILLKPPGNSIVSNLQLTATDDVTPAASLKWSNLQHLGALLLSLPTLDSTGHFSWNAAGSNFGLHQFTATVTDLSGNFRNDVALNVTVAPEPSSILLGGLALVGWIGLTSRKRVQ